MIVKMKKVTLVCLADARGRTLEALRDLGVLHLAHIKEPESADLDKTRDDLHRAQSALNILGLYLKKKDESAPALSSEVRSPTVGSRFPKRRTGIEVVEHVNDFLKRKKELTEKLEYLHSEKAAIEPFGNFDPALIKQLAEKGITVKLYHISGKKRVVPPEGAELFIIRQDATGQYFAIIGKGEFDFEGNEFPIPKRSLAEVLAELKTVNADLRDIENQLHALTGSQKSVEALISKLAEKLQYIEAQEGMGAANKLAYLQGFCPFNLVDKLRKTAAEQGWGLVVEEPSDNDKVPTLIRNPAWIRPIEVLFKILKVLPGYREVDVSAWFLPFFSLFFAMIVGDAGYGLIFLVITLWARRKFKTAPSRIFVLMNIFSICTIVWGILAGAYFGLADIPGPLANAKIKWLRTPEHVMDLCLLIGAIHLSLAHIWNAVRLMNSFQALAQLGWAGVTWSVFFLARNVLLSWPFPHWMISVSIVSIVTIVLFMTPWRKLKSQMVNYFMLPLTLVSGFGDVLSYLRLFALGIASIEVARACNTMAGNVGFGGILSSFGSALILFVGHTINIVLCCLSVLVHAVRLNALEFSMHLGLEWSGIEYKPFAGEQAGQVSD